MSWTAMSDLSAGDIVTEADMDAIRGNIEYLLDPNTDSVEYDNSGDYSTSSATFVDVDATNVSMSVTTNGGPLLIVANFYVTAAGAQVSPVGFQIDVGGSAAVTLLGVLDSALKIPVHLSCIYKPAAAGAQTIKLQYRGDGTDSVTIYCNGENISMFAAEI